MIALHKYKHVYVEIVKTGTTSIGRWLKNNYGGVDIQKTDATRHGVAIPLQYKDCKVFVTVRNPYERAYSYFVYNKYFKGTPCGVLRTEFKEFLRWLISCRDGCYKERHAPFKHSPQKKYYDVAGASIFIRVENFKKEAIDKLSFVRHPLSLMRILNATKGKHGTFKDCFGKEEEALVWEYCKEDFGAFGYERLRV